MAIYLAGLAARGQAPPWIARALAAIAHAHKRAGLVAPHRAEHGAVIGDVPAGIRRSRLIAPDRKTAADGDITGQPLKSITGDEPAALRDRTLIALAMALAAPLRAGFVTAAARAGTDIWKIQQVSRR